MYQNFIIPYLYEAQNVSGNTPPIIRSLKLHWQPLVYHTWKVFERVVGGRCHVHQLHVHQPSTYEKEKSNKMQQCIKILLFRIYMKLNMFRMTHRPSSVQF